MKQTTSACVKETRIRRCITQTNLAKMAMITPAAMSQIESGDRTPSTSVVKNIANALKVSTDFLLGLIETENHEDFSLDKQLQQAFISASMLTEKDKEKISDFIEFLVVQSEKDPQF